MALSGKIPTFNLKAVISETGIKAHKVRSWEKKYGLPRPVRSKGGHRIYTEHDISIVKWLMARLEEGMTIGRATQLWHNIEAKGEEPSECFPTKVNELNQIFENGNPLADLRQAWIDSCLNFDDASTDKYLTQAFAIYPIKMVCIEILQKGMSHIGDLWFQNKATVQQEHFASAKALKQLNTLVATAPPPTRRGRLIMTCPPHEEHTFSILLLTLLLRYQGWHVIYLGANLPIAQLKATVEFIRPDLVIFAAQRLETAASLAKATKLLAQLKIPAAFGGAVFNLIPSLRHHVDGHFLGETVEEGVQVVNKIMTFDLPEQKAKPLTHSYELALKHFDKVRYLIDFDIRQNLEQENIPFKYLEDTNDRFKKDILAGLSLGDLSLINPEFEVSQQLMHNFDIPQHLQHKYFHAYHRAAKKHLKADGQLIINWLDNLDSSLFRAPAQV